MNCSYNVLALSSRSALGAAFDGVPFLPSRFWDAKDRIVLDYISEPFGLSLHVLGNISSRCGPWALIESGPGSQILWPHNSPSKSCCPAPRTERRVLVSSGLCHGLPSLVFHQCRSLFVCQGDVGHNLLFNYRNLLFLVFLCKKRYFRFR